MTKSGFRVSQEALDEILKICKYFRGVENLGNGRFADRLVQNTIMNHAKARKDNFTLIELDVIPSIREITQTLEATTPIMDAARITEDSLRLTAVHEIGHAYVRYKLFNDPKLIQITINAEGAGSLGRVLMEADQPPTQSKDYLMKMIAVDLAGMAAEIVVRGEHENGNTSDLEKATDIAFNMVTRFGMSDVGLVYCPSASLHNERIYTEMNQILNSCLERAKNIISEHLVEVNCLVEILLKEKEITGEKFMNMVASFEM